MVILYSCHILQICLLAPWLQDAMNMDLHLVSYSLQWTCVVLILHLMIKMKATSSHFSFLILPYDWTVYYVDNTGRCIEGGVFCVGSGANLAYSIIDSASLKDLSVEEGLSLAQSAIRLATHRDGFSGGYINMFLLNSTGCHHMRRVDSRDILVWYEVGSLLLSVDF